MTSHIRYDDVKSMPESDEGWYPVAAQVGEEANRRSRRSDVTAVLSKTAGMGAPACFIPALAELHLNTDKVPFGEPDEVNLSDRLWCLEHAAAVGALCHEAAHARHTKWDVEAFKALGVTDRIMDVIVTLEEPRIEFNAIEFDAGARLFLRGCAMDIVAREFKVRDTPYGASVAAGLLLARVDANVLNRSEVEGFSKAIVAVLGESTLSTLRGLWRRFLRLRDDDYPGMVQVATEWLEALGMDPADPEDAEDDLAAGSLFGEGSFGSPGPADPDGEGESSDEGSEGSSGGSGDAESDQDADGEGEGEGSLAKAVSDRVSEVGAKAEDEVTARRGSEREARENAKAAADSRRRTEGKAKHEQVFPPGHGYSPEGDSRLARTREPKSEEKVAARVLAQKMKDLHFHDRTSTRTASDVPPGRLRGRALVGNAAARQAGSMGTSPAWQGRKHLIVPETPLTLALLADVSGSMGHAQEPLGSTQWIMSDAGSQIDAKVATVHFGIKARGRMRAGQRQDKVHIYHANDGHEAFKDAALAIDTELNLLDGRGARLMVVMSDGAFVHDKHRAYAEVFVPMAISKGVAVLWLQFTESLWSTYGGTAVDCRKMKPVDVARLVGDAAVEQMRKADQQRR